MMHITSFSIQGEITMPDELKEAIDLIKKEIQDDPALYFACVSSVYSAIHDMPDELFERDAARFIVDRVLGLD